MKKTKDGIIIASLTEVKNRTGDIFSLVDEYGEITLTSHSRPKYKIIKISLNEYINLEYESNQDIEIFNKQKSGSVPEAQSKFEMQNVQDAEPEWQSRETKNNLFMNSPFLKTQLIERDNLKTQSVTQSTKMDINRWNRNNSSEKKFVQLAIRPLI